MVTGDHLETAKSVAVATGILTLDQLDKEGYFMTGE
jgi:Ca2+-transporting ATPase